MFGASNPFGQSSNSPFGSPSVFGQTNNANNNPFAQKPFGSTSPFGAQTGGSIFGGTSTGVFGTQASSPIGSSTVFGASSAPAFGSSTPAFGASASPAFGASSSPAFGGSSVFGQKPAFGGFGSTTPSSPFGSSFQQSQPAFGSNLFGSSPFGASSQPAFGAPSTPTFGSTTTSAFGSTSTPAFGSTSTPAFGATSTPAFGSTTTPTFGNTGSAFGVSNSSVFGSSTPAFGSSSTPAFGASSTPAFGASSTPAFGASSTPAFGSSPTPAFGATSSPFNFGSSPAFGQSTPAFGSTPFGAQTTTPAFGSPGFGQSSFGGQRGGTRVTPYSQTPEADSGSGTQAAGKLESISAMPAYKEKSHEELRWEDYQLGDKGGPNPAAQSSGGMGFNTNNTQANPFSASPSFSQPANPFSSTTSTNPFAPKTSTFSTPAFGSSTPALGSSPFGTATSNPFGSTPSPTPSVFGSTPGFGSSTSASLFGTPNTSTFGSSSLFGTTQAQGASSSFASGLNFGNTQPSPLFQSSTPSLGQTSSPFGQATSAFGQAAPAFGQAAPAFGQSTPAFGQTSAFGGNLFSSTPSTSMGFNQTTPSLSMPFQSAQPTQNSGGFGFGAPAGGTSNIFGQNNFGQPSANQSPALAQAQSITNPFGTLPAMPQMSIGRAGNAPSIQYGISSLPVVDKPAPMRISSVLTSRHLSQRRIRLPARKYNPKNDGPKVSFFSDEEDTTSTPKADALFIPRENPRALVIRPLEQWPRKTSAEKPKTVSFPAQTNGEYTEFASTTHLNGHASDNGNRDRTENGFVNEQTTPIKSTQKTNGLHDDPKSDAYITLTGHRAGEAAIVYEHGADIEALMPKLRHSDYYTEPRIQELAAKERADPGFCRRVKDFVVGRHEYGSIKFLGETDVRRLELESLIQFNNREVIVYMDETKKPPVGQGLNKPAEVTLLNIKCFDKKTGRQFTEGPRIEKYKEMLKKKAEDQGAEFVSYDPIKGEWKFRVSHFSRYGLGDDDGVDDTA
ncbi:nuclear pore complex protein NUP98A isoform X2 [Rutidosis leptorrhynchoides]|uniref:nuclear pore complex protein NUP98A isoform X2 n=1 Tax=Rutidosis leptorrhynchoides TaxID=125765 RepID=UPI003A98E82D